MRIDLEAFAGGILSEKVNKAMEKIAENIVDPNTDPKAKRKIKITLTFSGKEPSYQTCEIAVDTVLAGEKASITEMTELHRKRPSQKASQASPMSSFLILYWLYRAKHFSK